MTHEVERLLKMGIREAARHEPHPPDALFDSMLDRALQTRGAGLEAGSDTPAAPLEVYRVAGEWLRLIVGQLSPSDATAITVYGSSVTELLRHLLAVERYVADRLGIAAGDVDASSGHLAMADPDHGADVGTLEAELRTVRSRVVGHVEALDEAELVTVVSVHGVSMSIAELLVVRAFELWTHGEDIGRATARRPPTFDPSALHTMAEVAATMLARLAQALDGTAQAFRLTLTGSGGGSWIRRFDGSGAGIAETADATLVADVTDFCRLVANRLDPNEFAAVRLGDEALAGRLVAMAPLLADYGEGVDFSDRSPR